MSLKEYESQLQDVEALLAESPDEEEFIKLKNDLLELIALEKEQQQEEQPEEAAASSIEAKIEASTNSSENATSASIASQGFEAIPETTETTTEAVPIAAKKGKLSIVAASHLEKKRKGKRRRRRGRRRRRRRRKRYIFLCFSYLITLLLDFEYILNIKYLW